jgi:hypothetical protein
VAAAAILVAGFGGHMGGFAGHGGMFAGRSMAMGGGWGGWRNVCRPERSSGELGFGMGGQHFHNRFGFNRFNRFNRVNHFAFFPSFWGAAGTIAIGLTPITAMVIHTEIQIMPMITALLL